MKRTKINIQIKDKNNNMNHENESIIDYYIEKDKYTFDLVTTWINNADTKIGISCALSSGVLAVIMFVLETFLSKIDINNGFNENLLNITIFFIHITIILFMLSIFFHFYALNPSLLSPKNNKNEYNGLFYGDIAKIESFDNYISKTKSTSKDTFSLELMEEIYINSKICTNKMKRFKKGMWFSLGSIACAIISGILYYSSINPIS